MLALDKLDGAEIGHYLAAQGVLADSAPLTVEALGGGVSNIVLRVTTPAQCWVLKQALPELRVAAYWPSRIDRAVREAEALRVVSGHLPSGAVPTVHFIDEENYIYGMSCAPDSATLWKEKLLAGEVELPVAAAAGRMLAQMHAIQDPAVRERFIDDEVFWQLRVDPYYNTIAEKYPSARKGGVPKGGARAPGLPGSRAYLSGSVLHRCWSIQIGPLHQGDCERGQPHLA